MSSPFEICDIKGSSLNAEQFRARIAQATGAIAFVGHPSVSVDDLTSVAAHDSDVMVYIVDAATGTGGRGAADLIGTLWQSFPKVAALVSHALPATGAVVFSAEAIRKFTHAFEGLGEPVTAAVADRIGSGGIIRAVLIPEATISGPAAEPAPLSPRRPTKHAKLLEALFSNAGGALWAGAQNAADIAALQAGLLLWHDALDEGHEFCQSAEGKGKNRAADYCHAIMHRREPDYGNAKYWFRRVGYHPAYDALVSRAKRLATLSTPDGAKVIARLCRDDRWHADAFVEACESVSTSDGEADLLLRRLQSDEMLLLLWQTCKDIYES